MATLLVVEKMGGSYLSPSLPVFVYNDDYSALTLLAAETAINAAYGGQIPSSANGLPPDGNPNHQQLSKSAYRFTINYKEPNRRSPAPPTAGVIRPRIDAVAQRKEVRWAPERGCYVDSSLAAVLGGSFLSFSPFRGMVNVQFTGLLAVNFGAVIDPPEPNLGVEMTVPTTTVTPSWRRTVALCVGRVNSASLSGGTYSAGEIFLHSVHLQLVSETECGIQIAWSYKPNVTGEARGPITGVAYHGHDFVWEKPKILIDDSRNLALPIPEMVIINKVWPETDLSAIGISPPS